MNNDRLYTIKEIANILNLSEPTIRRKIRLKEISAEKKSNTAGYRISKEALLEYGSKNGKYEVICQEINKEKNTIAAVAGATGAVLGATTAVVAPGAVLGATTAVAAGSIVGAVAKFFLGIDEKLKDKEYFNEKKLKAQQALLERGELELKLAKLEDDKSIEHKKKILNIKMNNKELEASINICEINLKKARETALKEAKELSENND